jgi:hypothetical protein
VTDVDVDLLEEVLAEHWPDCVFDPFVPPDGGAPTNWRLDCGCGWTIRFVGTAWQASRALWVGHLRGALAAWKPL